ncbi:MAG: DUF4126 domain-containing protein [Alphaproteobacteria bacterium]|nr:DUF4126 domain-containing protein [Alphaproteobacteria bacterium]
MLYLLALLIGGVAGLRTFTAPVAVAWAAVGGWLALAGTPFSFMATFVAAGILSALALGELVVDTLPSTPSRKAPPGFIARLVSGGFSGAVVGAAGGSLFGGAMAGLAGAVAGTLGGYAFRMRLARALGKDLPAALIEDAIALGGAALIMLAAR